MAESFDPYHRWLGIPPKDQPAHHYRLLGLDAFESDVEAIRDAAEQRIAHVRTYQLARHSELSQKILNELAAAKACLLDPEHKAAYDAQLRATLSAEDSGVRSVSLWKWLALAAAGLWIVAGLVVAVVLTGESRSGSPTAQPSSEEAASGSTAAEEGSATAPADPASAAARGESSQGRDGSAHEAASLQGVSSNAPPLAVAPFDAAEAKRLQEAWAKHLGVPVERPNAIGMRMLLVPPGEFLMGTPGEEKGPRDQKPQHRVRITRPFRLAVHEVTVGQFRSFVDATGYQTEAEVEIARGGKHSASKKKRARAPRGTWQNSRSEQTDDHPVVLVSWNDAKQFCTWLSEKEGREYRLPVEAEWEYAARAGTQKRFLDGDDAYGSPPIGNLADASLKESVPRHKRAAAESDGYAFTAPVGRFRPNQFGLCDVLGNAAELCADWYDLSYYAQSPENDPPGPAHGERHVARGGSWLQLPLSVADRWPMPLIARNDWMGFRVACDVEPASKRP